jgi:hypothetical protein
MIVGLYLEGAGPAVTNVYQPGIFLTCTYQKAVALPGERLEPAYGVFVGAVFRPHDGIDTQFRKVGYPAHELADTVKFLSRKA